jgi:hypothetical protein
MNLGDMPLDSKEHVRAAWHLVTGMAYKCAAAKAAGLPRPLFIPSDEELEIAWDMIRLAAEGFGMGGQLPEIHWLD